MTVYSTDPARLAATARETLISKIAPAITDGAASQELASLVEALDNIAPRLTWDPVALDRVCERTALLAEKIGAPTPADGHGDARERLTASRRGISEVLGSGYRDGTASQELVDAVGEFTRDDVLDQISISLRRSMED